MAKIVECVPNISEGRDKNAIKAVADEVRNTKNVTLLDLSSDESHNRSVITFIGSPEAVLEASVKLAKKASELIDMTKHKGEHPRMGAVDVVPFIPIKEMTMDECVALSKKAAERIWEEVKIPVFLYEKSASGAHRVNLADIRRGQFEGMPEKLLQDEWAPDFGERKIHPTAGVVAVGARMPLVAFNINLETSDVEIASKIAKTIRFSSGGFPCVKSIGVKLEDKNMAQVSINMTDFTTTPLYKVFETVKEEAERYGTKVVESEIIGLSPMMALIDCAKYYMNLSEFDEKKQVIENYLI